MRITPGTMARVLGTCPSSGTGLASTGGPEFHAESPRWISESNRCLIPKASAFTATSQGETGLAMKLQQPERIDCERVLKSERAVTRTTGVVSWP